MESPLDLNNTINYFLRQQNIMERETVKNKYKDLRPPIIWRHLLKMTVSKESMDINVTGKAAKAVVTASFCCLPELDNEEAVDKIYIYQVPQKI